MRALLLVLGDDTLLALALRRETRVTLQLCRDGDIASWMTTDTIDDPGDVTFDPPRPTTEQYVSTRWPRFTARPDIDARTSGDIRCCAGARSG
ncbi:MAG TPA: hypothetical protein VL400_19045 [Polyangiaceae bacterium]|nr:hypothetical protein [Polyangiaceae bacterium]